MKRIIFFTVFVYCFVVSGAVQAAKVLNIYTWANYVPQNVLQQFEKETGIHVNCAVFDDNQMLYAKLKASGKAGFDIVFPSTYLVDRLRREKMLIPLDKRQIKNFKFLKKTFLNQSFDPKNRYSVPYLWGTTGILINTRFVKPKSVTSWADLWARRFKDQVGLLDDMRDVFNMAMKILGYSINDTDPTHIRAAYLKIKALLPNVRSFHKNGSQQLYINGDIKVGMIASGDAYNVTRKDPALRFIYPKEGANIWMDSLVIPKGAQHIQEAYAFIEFVLRPDVAKMISEEVGYSTPNRAAVLSMKPALSKNPILNPTTKELGPVETETDFDRKTRALYLFYWDKLKMG